MQMTQRFVICGVVLMAIGANVARADQPQPAAPFVMGYADRLSCVPGETVSFHLSASGTSVDLLIRRLGAESVTVYEQQGVPCATHPIPDRASSDGCEWPATTTLTIPDDWRSGYYEVTLTLKGEAEPTRNTLFFVVRAANPGSHAKILLQLATNTYNAYTNWGGHSLYAYHDRDGLQGHRVSFDRPLQSLFANWELPFVKWAEAMVSRSNTQSTATWSFTRRSYSTTTWC